MIVSIAEAGTLESTLKLILTKTLGNNLDIWKFGSPAVDAYGLYDKSSLLFNYPLLFNSVMNLQVGKKTYQPGQPGVKSFEKGISREGEDDSQSWEEAVDQAGKHLCEKNL